MGTRTLPCWPLGPANYLKLALAILFLSTPTRTLAEGGLDRLPSPPDAMVYIISPAAGETVSSPVTVRFGLKGMGVTPAGIERGSTGHHHLLIDTEAPDLSLPVPADANHIHYGGGQTEAIVELEPGPHSLRLLLGDYRHIPHDPPIISEQIEILVE